MLALMKVNLLQGTCTPTLTPMPGVHKPFHLTAARLRFGMNTKSYGGAAPLSGWYGLPLGKLV
jgi:hypothetical protein